MVSTWDLMTSSGPAEDVRQLGDTHVYRGAEWGDPLPARLRRGHQGDGPDVLGRLSRSVLREPGGEIPQATRLCVSMPGWFGSSRPVTIRLFCCNRLGEPQQCELLPCRDLRRKFIDRIQCRVKILCTREPTLAINS